MAQYLDNDGNNEVDNPAVVQAMIDNGSVLIMSATSKGIEDVFEKFEQADLMNEIDGYTLQDCYGSETKTSDAADANVPFDASLEEVLHLITHSGYAIAFPDDFAEGQARRGEARGEATMRSESAFMRTLRYARALLYQLVISLLARASSGLGQHAEHAD